MGKQQDLVVADLPGEMDKDYEILQKAHSEYRTAGDRPRGFGWQRCAASTDCGVSYSDAASQDVLMPHLRMF